jgi:hypothetical protein
MTTQLQTNHEFTFDSFDYENFDESTCNIELCNKYDESDFTYFYTNFKSHYDFEPMFKELLRCVHSSEHFYIESIKILNELAKSSDLLFKKNKFDKINTYFQETVNNGKSVDNIVSRLSKLSELGFVPRYSVKEAYQYRAESYKYRVCMYLLLTKAKELM